MRLGVVSNGILQFDVEEGLAFLQRLKVEEIEIGCAGFHRQRKYGDPAVLVQDNSARARWLEMLERHGLRVCALAVHGPALSPDEETARTYAGEFRLACELASLIGVERLTLLAGLPEGAPGDSSPHWVVNAWPPGSDDVRRWQWEERVIPYWRQQAGVATDHGCRLCFEMHPNDIVYNPAAFVRLREAVGDVVGCNLDPSHLFWQGIDPVEVARFLGPAVYHVHAKDTRVNRHVVRLNGVLDSRPPSDIGKRAWEFRTVGYGHGESFWRDFLSTLRAIGYDDVVSIEHEDDYLDPREGLEKSVAFLTPLLPERPRVSFWDEVEAAGR